MLKKVLLYPGAFNPPHNGHTETLVCALKKYSFGEVWVVPSGNRADKKIEVSLLDRRELNTLFVEHLNEVLDTVCILRLDELENPENKETPQVLDEIKAEQGVDITQLIGLDGYLSLKKYLPWETFSKEKFLIVSNRIGYEVPSDFTFPENHKLITSDHVQELSSTMIRDLIKAHDDSYKGFTIKKIAEYIESKGLYC